MKRYLRSALVALLMLTGAGGSVAPVFAADLATSLEQSNRNAKPLKSASGEYKEALFIDTFERTELEGADAGSEGKFGRIQTSKWVVAAKGRKGPVLEEGKLWMDEGGGAFSKVGGKSLIYLDHNFIDENIRKAGGFHIRMKVDKAGSWHNRFIGFAVGSSTSRLEEASAPEARLESWQDFFVGYMPCTSKRNKIHIIKNGKPYFTEELPTFKFPEELRADFKCENFKTGTPVDFTITWGEMLMASGRFRWSETNQNYIAIFGNPSQGNATVDSFAVVPGAELQEKSFAHFDHIPGKAVEWTNSDTSYRESLAGASVLDGQTALWLDGKALAFGTPKQCIPVEETDQRVRFQLVYEKELNGALYREEKTIQLEQGHSLYYARSRFFKDGVAASELPLAIRLPSKEGASFSDEKNAAIGAWEKIGTAARVRSEAFDGTKKTANEIFLLAHTDERGTLDYVAGKSGSSVQSPRAWQQAVVADPQLEEQAVVQLILQRSRAIRMELGRYSDEQIREVMDSQTETGQFSLLDYRTITGMHWAQLNHLVMLRELARVYNEPESGLTKELALKKVILAGLDYWLDTDPRNGNWWYMEIGSPKALVRLLIEMEDEIPLEQQLKAFPLLERTWVWNRGSYNETAEADIAAAFNLLTGNYAQANKRYNQIYPIISSKHYYGIQVDNSWFDHGLLLYNNSYGAGFLKIMARLLRLVSETPMDASPERIKILTDYALDGTQWMNYGKLADLTTRGRSITKGPKHKLVSLGERMPFPGEATTENGRGLGTSAPHLLHMKTGREEEIKNLIARKKDIDSAPLFTGNRCFYRGEIMTHHGDGFYASARGFNKDLFNTESDSDQGFYTHHMADGVNFLYIDQTGWSEIQPFIDWQKIPGTTAEQGPALVKQKSKYKTDREFVGGVSDGTCGLMTIDLKRYNLTARKSYFFFKDRYACLGTGITSTTNHPVFTTVAQYFWEGDISCNGKTWRPVSGGAEFTDATRIYHNKVGYLIPDGNDTLWLNAETVTSNWKKVYTPATTEEVQGDIFTLGLDHGTKPENNAYSYFVYPAMTEAEFEKAAKDPQMTILSNTETLQAVVYATDGVLMASFYEPGKVEFGKLVIEVDQPCLVLFTMKNGKGSLAVSDPTGKLKQATVSVSVVSGKITGEYANYKSGKTEFDVAFPQNPEGGKSVVFEILSGK